MPDPYEWLVPGHLLRDPTNYEYAYELGYDVSHNRYTGQYRIVERHEPINDPEMVELPPPPVREEVSMPYVSPVNALNDPPVFENIVAPARPPVPAPPIPNADNLLWVVTDGTMTELRTEPCQRCGTQLLHSQNVREQMVNELYARANQRDMAAAPGLCHSLIMCATCATTLEYTVCDQCSEPFINPHHNDFAYPDHSVNSRYGICLSNDAVAVCEVCAEDYHCCTRCDGLSHLDDGEYLDESFYCQECLSDAREEYYDANGHIQEYHSADKTDQFFSLGDDDAARGFMGIELEVENNGRLIDNNTMSGNVIDSLPHNLVVMERDGSIRSGFEIITKPLTYGYWQDVRQQWHDLLKMLADNGYRSHNGGNCGIHVHLGVTALGKTQSEREATLTKITWVYENYWDDIVKFSRRSSNRINEWACRYGQSEWHTLDRIVKSKGDGAGKYASINMSPMDTIEFRVFRGTLVTGSFDAIIDFVWGLLEGVKRMTMDDMEQGDSLYDFIHPEYLNDNLIEYMRGREIDNPEVVADVHGEQDLEDDA